MTTFAAHLVTSRRCLEHRVAFGYPEAPARLEAILRHAEAAGAEILEAAPHPATREAILRVHPERYVARFEAAVKRGDGLFGSPDNPLGPGTFAAATAAVDAVLAAADRALARPGEGPFAAVRPPGHHAERELAMGFCYFNNVAVAAEHLLAAHGLARVAIFDFDVHHGNGTQHRFEERADVLYVSTHQFPFYPGTGAAGERGRGAGRGTTLNVPLAAGSGDEEYAEALSERVLPALEAFAPDALVVSAGFDAWRGDPLGGMRVSEEGFAAWGERLGDWARRRCGGRLLSVLEGGYDLAALPRLVAAYAEAVGRGLAAGGAGAAGATAARRPAPD